jgi:hypothetical protein
MNRALAVPGSWCHAVKKRGRRESVWALCLLSWCLSAHAADPPEYRLKAAFVYNFALFTEWPGDAGMPLNLCVYGSDPFGPEIDVLQGKAIGDRTLAVYRKPVGTALTGCQIVFIAHSAIGRAAQVLKELQGSAVLTVADSPGAARQGVVLNMSVSQNKVSFEANLLAARDAGIKLSSKLLRLATEVIQ